MKFDVHYIKFDVIYIKLNVSKTNHVSFVYYYKSMLENISHFLFCMIIKGKTVQLTLIRNWVFDIIFGTFSCNCPRPLISSLLRFIRSGNIETKQCYEIGNSGITWKNKMWKVFLCIWVAATATKCHVFMPPVCSCLMPMHEVSRFLCYWAWLSDCSLRKTLF